MIPEAERHIADSNVELSRFFPIEKDKGHGSYECLQLLRKFPHVKFSIMNAGIRTAENRFRIDLTCSFPTELMKKIVMVHDSSVMSTDAELTLNRMVILIHKRSSNGFPASMTNQSHSSITDFLNGILIFY